MYQLVRARHRLDRRAGRWVEANMATANLATLPTVYGDVYLYITWPGFNGVRALHFEKTHAMRQGLAANLTVQGWLDLVGNTTLPFDDELPNETIRLVEYAQAWHAGYDIQTRARNGSVDSNISTHEQEDLLLTHPQFTPEYIDHHCLFSVNGFIHLSDWGTDGVRIVDGNRTIRKSNDNQVGLISFENIGTIQKVPITEEMLWKQNEESTYHAVTYVTLPDEVDIENKTVLLVLGGYLCPLDKTYIRTGDRTWRINLRNILFLERYLESVRDMDMSALGLSDDPDSPTLLSVNEMKGDSAMLAYLTMSQTFFVVVDCPSLFHVLTPLEYAGYPGRYLNQDGRQLPAVGAYGRQLEYHTIEEHGYWVYCCSNNDRFNYAANTVDWTQDTLVNSGLVPENPKQPAQAYLRLLGTEA